MNSSNVSNMLIQVSNINIDIQSPKMVSTADRGSFEKTLQNVAEPNSSTQTVKSTSQPKEKEDFKPVNKLDSKEKPLENTSDESKDIDEEVVSEVAEATGKITEIIEKELDVTEEDIEKALENLGLTMVDLLNPQSLAEVVAKLTGEEDSITLVMSDEFKNILDSVTQLTDELFEKTGMDFSKVKQIFDMAQINVNEMELTVQDEPVADEPLVNAEIPEEDIASKPVVQNEAVSDIPLEPKKDLNVGVAEEQSQKPQVPEEENTIKVQLTEEKDSSNQTGDEDGTEAFTEKTPVKNQIKNDSEPIIRAEGMIFSDVRVEAQFLPDAKMIALPTGEIVTTEEIINQFVEQAKILNDAESTTMEITLNPEGLGKIFLEVTQKGDEITAKIFTENDAVKQALESQMANLKVEMNQNATKVTSIEVSVGTHEFERNLEENPRGDERREEHTEQSRKKATRINLNNLDELSGLMSEEELLIAQMMRDNGNTLDFQA